jgi:hypothetical protein
MAFRIVVDFSLFTGTLIVNCFLVVHFHFCHSHLDYLHYWCFVPFPPKFTTLSRLPSWLSSFYLHSWLLPSLLRFLISFGKSASPKPFICLRSVVPNSFIWAFADSSMKWSIFSWLINFNLSDHLMLLQQGFSIFKSYDITFYLLSYKIYFILKLSSFHTVYTSLPKHIQGSHFDTLSLCMKISLFRNFLLPCFDQQAFP